MKRTMAIMEGQHQFTENCMPQLTATNIHDVYARTLFPLRLKAVEKEMVSFLKCAAFTPVVRSATMANIIGMHHFNDSRATS